jgi:hypothetical protein
VVAEVIKPEFDEPYDPHIVLPTIDGNVHVLSVHTMERFCAGDPGVELDPITMRSIVTDWLQRIGAPPSDIPDPTDAEVIKFPGRRA